MPVVKGICLKGLIVNSPECNSGYYVVLLPNPEGVECDEYAHLRKLAGIGPLSASQNSIIFNIFHLAFAFCPLTFDLIMLYLAKYSL